MANKPAAVIEFDKLKGFIDRKQNIVAYVHGFVNNLPFEGVAYFENQLYSTIDLSSVIKLKSADNRMIKMKLKRAILVMDSHNQASMKRIEDTAIMYHSKLYKELDAKHNGHPIALNVPEKDSSLVQELGGIWHPIIKRWVVLSKNPNIKKFNQWAVGAVY